MSWWLLLLEVTAVWLLWAGAAATQRALEEARRGIPKDRRGGVSVFPLIPLVPLAFWGAALVADLVIGPWGTVVVGWLHAGLGVVFVGSASWDLWRLRSISERT